MKTETIKTIGALLLGVMVLAGCGVLIFFGRGDQNQAWFAVGVVLTWAFTTQTASSSAAQTVAGQQTTTVTGQPPNQQITVGPTEDTGEAS